MVRRLPFPATPPPPTTVWSGRGGRPAGVCGEGSRPFQLKLEAADCSQRGLGSCASHKPYVARTPAFTNLSLHFRPYTQP